jgi:hypothetical protein
MQMQNLFMPIPPQDARLINLSSAVGGTTYGTVTVKAGSLQELYVSGPSHTSVPIAVTPTTAMLHVATSTNATKPVPSAVSTTATPVSPSFMKLLSEKLKALIAPKL